METLTISQIKRAAPEGRVEAVVHGQVEALVQKETKDGKPFWELTLADAEEADAAGVERWAGFCGLRDAGGARLSGGDGEFTHQSAFGLDARRWTCRPLVEDERDALLAGPPELRTKQAADFALLEVSVASIGDPRLLGLARLFLAEYGARFRRCAAARGITMPGVAVWWSMWRR